MRSGIDLEGILHSYPKGRKQILVRLVKLKIVISVKTKPGKIVLPRGWEAIHIARTFMSGLSA